ncbi:MULTISPECIES: HAMP domain-containing sensor histidine kinase [unclassified Fusibacter]|uniref:sensor histidine kinase n=1 Tax=unclassified Fusibacter TaxID=2624464 RepID=UPI001013C137|nr:MULTISPECIES: sensor histidine kinase [unclassified Fusibacter]MCK8058618.1 sensor histidine kinase [Fusibacter sp. A2]NPE22612.1 sensor histidine kinase [Fusibacter sp. A1]RXV60177.1 sensor histidine kinase [Fusibacter sp. A1]
MSLLGYLSDKKVLLGLHAVLVVTLYFTLKAFMMTPAAIGFVLLLIITTDLVYVIYDVFRRYTYYKNIESVQDTLDKKYLIAEVVENPSFFEAQVMFELLQSSLKSMNDEIGMHQYASKEYREYIEAWVHEIKSPIAAVRLMMENDQISGTSGLADEMARIEEYIEQALFYARSTQLSNDYSIKTVELRPVVNEVIKKKAKSLIGIGASVDTLGVQGLAPIDTKWFQFILGQIVSNSIKYRKENLTIKIWTRQCEHSILLYIEDNGCGIAQKDLENVFNMGFVGVNGRKNSKSTGLGLYLCKTLCAKMSLAIGVESIESQFTRITISLPMQNNY